MKKVGTQVALLEWHKIFHSFIKCNLEEKGVSNDKRRINAESIRRNR